MHTSRRAVTDALQIHLIYTSPNCINAEVMVQAADSALALNKTLLDGCEIMVALAAHCGGVGTHPAIQQQVRHRRAHTSLTS